MWASLARNTLPNLPYPSLFNILKFYFEIECFSEVFSLSGDFVWLRRKEGRVFSLRLPSVSCSLELESGVLFLLLESRPL